jgi:antitoxin (DNA-binding transcriptional repressor) of toxin-antitoxin stability system
MTETTHVPDRAVPTMITSTKLANGLGGVLVDVMTGEHHVVTRAERPVAALVPMPWYEARRRVDLGLTAGVRDPQGDPVFRDDYAVFLAKGGVSALDGADAVGVTLTAGETEAVSSLLDELAAVYPGEPLGRLARTLAVKINDRVGL